MKYISCKLDDESQSQKKEESDGEEAMVDSPKKSDKHEENGTTENPIERDMMFFDKLGEKYSSYVALVLQATASLII